MWIENQNTFAVIARFFWEMKLKGWRKNKPSKKDLPSMKK
jgi:hypothetical protein